MSTQVEQSVDQTPAHDIEAETIRGVCGQHIGSSSDRRPFLLLVVSASEADYGMVKRISTLLGWRLHLVSTYHAASGFLTQNDEVAAVMCDCDLPDGTWKDVLGEVSKHARQPELIVASNMADARTWAEALNLGACDLLAKPLDKKELIRSLAAVWRHWKDDRI